jgi:predicted Zn-dependent protease with MMP-like domain
MEDAELYEQVEITLLHEIGHFFNLDEDDLARLGLD